MMAFTDSVASRVSRIKFRRPFFLSFSHRVSFLFAGSFLLVQFIPAPFESAAASSTPRRAPSPKRDPMPRPWGGESR